MCILHSGLAGRELYKHHMQLGNVSERCVLSRLGFPRHKNSSTRVTFAGTCLLPEGGRRRAWHITAVQLPPDQLRETPLQDPAASLPARRRFPQLELDHNSCSYQRHCRALLPSEFPFPYQKPLFSAEQTRPANKTSRWDLPFHNTATMNH